MFKFKSYKIKKTEEKNENKASSSKTTTPSYLTGTSSSSSKTTIPSYSTGTLKKTTSSSSSSSSSSSYVSPKKKTMPSAAEIKAVSNKKSPEYSRKIYPKKTVTEWHLNKTFSAKSDTKKVVIPSPHKKLERK